MIPRLLRSVPDFRRLWAAQTVSLFGDQVSFIAVPLIAVIVLHADAARMGALTASMLVPNLFFALHFGSFMDRAARKRPAMIAADIGRAILLATLPAAFLLGLLTFAQLIVVGFLAGTLSVLFQVSYASIVASIIPREHYVRANQLLNGSRAFSFLAGPSIGGLIAQALSAPIAVVLDAVSFVVSAIFVGRIRAPEAPPEPVSRGHLAAGLRFIAGSHLLRASLLATTTINLFNFAFSSLFVLYANRSLGVSPGTLGVVMGAGAVGSIAGSVATGRIAERIGVGPAFILGCIVFPAPLLLVPLAGGSLQVALALLFLSELGSGFGVMVLDITAGAIRQAIVPETLRSRVSGAYMLVNYGVRPIGSLLGGALGTWLGLRPALWIATTGAVAGALFLFPSPARTMRTLPETAGE